MNDSESPKYLLKFDELVTKTVKDTYYKIKMAVLIIVGIIIVGSLIFQDNLFTELGWTARIILLSLFIGTLFTGKTEKINSPIEIRFYDDHLVIYRKKRFYSKKVSRMEYNKFFYKDITSCEYNTKVKRFDIVGKISATWYNYNKDGSLSLDPTYNRIIDGGICYFYTDLDITKEIEKHSPIKIKKK